MGYLAFMGPDEAVVRILHRRAVRRALLERGCEARFEGPGLVLFLDGETPALPIAGDRGMVAGTLFTRSDRPARVTGLDPRAAEDLMQGHWGAYVAFLRTPHSVLAVRDPSGAIPAHHARCGDAWLAFDDAALPLELGLIDPAPDEAFPRQWLCFPHLRTARTGLAAVRELLPGTALSVSPGGACVRSVWSPWDHAGSHDARRMDFEEAAAALRDEALRSIPRQAESSRRGLLELSGGLDSSIVAAALAIAGRSVSAITFATRSPEGDERRHARKVAQAFSIPLEEVVESPCPAGLDLPGFDPLRPGRSPVLAPLDQGMGAHARAIGADAFLTGAGGDNLFCYLTTAAPILDALRSAGPRAGARALGDVAGLCGCTGWAALGAALRKAASPRPAWKRDEAFLLASGGSEPDPHPWLEAPPDALPGKREHVEALVRIQHFLHAGARGAPIPTLSPLLAQPLMEVALRIPTWLWVKGGRNRAVARSAFEPILPADIVRRRTKGRLEGLCQRAFVAHRRDIADLIGHGLLVEAGLVDGPAVEAYLARPGEPSDGLYFRVLDLVTLELWVRRSREAAARRVSHRRY